MEKIKSFKHFYRNPVKLKNFVINGIGVCEAMQPGIVNRPGGTGDSLLMFFHDEAIVNIKDELLTVAAGSLIYWDKCGHYYGNADIPWRHSWIHLSTQGTVTWFQAGFIWARQLEEGYIKIRR